MTLTLLLVAAIVAAVAFDFTNGFHDSANLIATAVASRALRPAPAVLIAAAFTFIGPLLVGTAVADTVGEVVSLKGLPEITAVGMILCAATGAVAWNLGTWLLGIPSSSSHALVGALCGPALLVRGSAGVNWGLAELTEAHTLIGMAKVLTTLLLSPVLGFAMGYLMQAAVRRLLRRATPRINKPIKLLQIAGTASMSFAHGANDAQKTMGVIALVLLLSGHVDRFVVPTWVIMLCASAITAGTVVGGWRIVRTVGFGIYRLRPLHALETQAAASVVILGAAAFGGPVSTTHVVSSSIMGVGASERIRGVRWGKVGEIAWTWLVTIPGAAALSVALWLLLSRFLPTS